MILFRFLPLFLLVFWVLPAHAQLNAMQSRIFGGDRSNPDFVRPGLNDGKTWPAVKDEWTPDEWTENRGNPQAVVDGFYRNGLLVGQTSNGKTPVIEVGENFMKLSNRDMNRVAAYLDAAYGYTNNTGGMFFMHYGPAKKPFGVYTKNGLVLQ
ncbi:MAG: hypothetical protein ACT4OY_03970 [Alphaproteobacteria bacterium]